jgi:hypothetical protein
LALLRHPIEIWRFDYLVTIAAEISVAEVVDEDENDVWWICFISQNLQSDKAK